MDIIQQKNLLREKIKELKSKLTFDEKKKISERILSKVEKDEAFINSKIILCYWSMPDEVQTQDFILKWANTKQFILPCINGDILDLKAFSGKEKLKSGEKYNIQEPDGEIFNDIEKIDFAIIPGIAFDKKNNRMGRGKAYYDKLLIKLKSYNIGICFSFQLIDFVPHDDFDIKIDKVYTE